MPTHPSPGRRTFLLAASSLPLATSAFAWADNVGDKQRAAEAASALATLETAFGGRLGVSAMHTADGAHLAYRGNERFALCSTVKVMIAGAILQRSTQVKGLLQQRIRYPESELVSYSPITEDHVADGMTVAELCAAGLQYSDNSAANLLIKLLGGLAGVNAFARSIGDREFRLDRWETELNSALPGDPRDTTTPDAMARSLQKLAVGDALAPALRQQLQDWMDGNTTGATRIRAGAPAGWQIGDKTGTGDYGSANDIGVLRAPGRAPLVVAIYTTQHQQDAKARSDVIASATKIIVDWMG